jgi:hypothetical protein
MLVTQATLPAPSAPHAAAQPSQAAFRACKHGRRGPCAGLDGENGVIRSEGAGSRFATSCGDRDRTYKVASGHHRTRPAVEGALEQSVLGEAVDRLGDDQMIEYAHVDKRERVL